MPTPKREVSIRPPDNVWRLLGKIKGSGINVSANESWWYVLECLKSMYGLNDAPLAWQLCLQDYFVLKRSAIQSAFDDCFFFWPDKPGSIAALGGCHVDDNEMAGTDQWLIKEFNHFKDEFGGATREG